MAADPIEPDRVNIYERWESKLHLDAHLAGIVGRTPPMQDVRSVDITRYEITASDPLQG